MNCMQDSFYHSSHDTSMQASRAGGDHTRGENGSRHMFDIIGNGVIASRNGSICLGCAIEREGAARTDPQFDGAVVAGGAYQFNDITLNARINAYAANEFLQNL